MFESYVRTRPADANRIAPLVRKVFERRAFVVDPPALTRLSGAHSFRPGLVAPKFGELLKRRSIVGENDFARGEVREVLIVEALRDDVSYALGSQRERPRAGPALLAYTSNVVATAAFDRRHCHA